MLGLQLRPTWIPEAALHLRPVGPRVSDGTCLSLCVLICGMKIPGNLANAYLSVPGENTAHTMPST